MKRHKTKCEGCDGKGWLLFKDNTIMRCDQCEKYRGDLEAAIAFFESRQGRGYALAEIIITGVSSPPRRTELFIKEP